MKGKSEKRKELILIPECDDYNLVIVLSVKVRDWFDLKYSCLLPSWCTGFLDRLRLKSLVHLLDSRF